MQEAITAVETTDQPTPQREAMTVPVVEDTPEHPSGEGVRFGQPSHACPTSGPEPGQTRMGSSTPVLKAG